jgi:hypothetical protein
LGPPIDLIEKGVALKERNSDNTNTAERNFAGAVYDVAINPAINLVASNLAGPGRCRRVQRSSSARARTTRVCCPTCGLFRR